MTSVQLFKDIGLNMSMKKTIDFPSKTAQNTWFNSHESTVVNDVAFNKLQNELHLPMDYGSALQYTYVRFSNLDQSGKIYYYFISDCALIDDSTVAFTLVLDPIQTFMCEYELDECMVTREHCDRWGTGVNPIRITPSNDGVNAFYKLNTKQKITSSQFPNLGVVVITFTSPILRFAVMSPVTYVENRVEYELDKGVYYGFILVDLAHPDTRVPTVARGFYTNVTASAGSSHAMDTYYPSLNEIISGDYQSSLPLVDDAIISLSILPSVFFSIQYANGKYEIIPFEESIIDFTDMYYDDIAVKDVKSLGYIVNTNDYINTLGVTPVSYANYTITTIRSPSKMVGDYISCVITDANWFKPVKPSNNDNESDTHEPALYMAPYVSRRIVTKDGSVVKEFTDTNILNTTIKCTQITSSGNVGVMFAHTTENPSSVNFVDDSSEGECESLLATTLDVTSDQWKTYVYTKRDTDRQLVSNQAWQRALDNLFFMSYGGALVGSRSASGKDDPMKTKGAKGLVPKFNANMLGAVGLAAGASVVTSLIDAHYMWQNQMIKEKQIRNEPTIISSIGEGIQSFMLGLKDYYFVTMKVDDVNWTRAYENFKKYGYIVNEFEKPNTSSRKYFNYILTNGAIIKGNIPQSIKDQISAIYDAGITIFHGDYASTLDYEDITKENIERSLI